MTDRAIDTETLAARIAAGTAPAILDVRSRAEFDRGHIPGAIHIPFWRIGAHTDRLPEKTSEVVIYCGHGPRAAWAMRTLRRRGFTGVIELAGHWSGWLRSIRG
jgi:rhodanese-related sulfurtransferase